MSMTCAHRGSAGAAPARDAWQDRHSAGGPAVSLSSGSGSRLRPFPWWPGCPPRFRSLLRSRSDRCRAFRCSPAAMPSFEVGVPDSSCPSPAGAPPRPAAAQARDHLRAASCAARSTAISSSFAAITARSRAFAARSPAASSGAGSPGTREGCHARPRHANRRTPNPAGRHAPGESGANSPRGTGTCRVRKLTFSAHETLASVRGRSNGPGAGPRPRAGLLP